MQYFKCQGCAHAVNNDDVMVRIGDSGIQYFCLPCYRNETVAIPPAIGYEQYLGCRFY